MGVGVRESSMNMGFRNSPLPSNCCRVEFTVELYLTCFHCLLRTVSVTKC